MERAYEYLLYISYRENMMEKMIEKATFSEIYKIVKKDKKGDIINCFNNVFNVALLFFPCLMCKEVALITNIGNGVNLLGAKQTISKGIK
jgi:hypothetical protein